MANEPGAATALTRAIDQSVDHPVYPALSAIDQLKAEVDRLFVMVSMCASCLQTGVSLTALEQGQSPEAKRAQDLAVYLAVTVFGFTPWRLQQIGFLGMSSRHKPQRAHERTLELMARDDAFDARVTALVDLLTEWSGR